MEKEVRARIQRATQEGRHLLEREFTEQLEGVYDIHLNGTVATAAGFHLAEDAQAQRARIKLVAAVAHHRAQGLSAADAVAALRRECAFTTFNRFAALKMLEAREIVLECVSRGTESKGFKEFLGLAPGLAGSPDSAWRLYLECVFDEIGREVRVLFDRRDPASLLWPRRAALDALLGILNDTELGSVWGEDETIGWVYQYFNGDDERKQMRTESDAPRSSRELAVRNQFFTPRYVVEFLVDNTLGQTWIEMRRGQTHLVEDCRYLVRPLKTLFLAEGEASPDGSAAYLPHRAKKDPRDIRVLDPASGSGHFLLYAFDLLLRIYEEAWEDAASPVSDASGWSLRADYPTIAGLRLALPSLILRHNLYGVDIDPRAAQIAALALWMRAQRAWGSFRVVRPDRPLVTRSNVVVAEAMPGERNLLEDFCHDLDTEVAALVRKVFDEMALAGEAGTLLRIEETVRREMELRFSRGGLYAEQDRKRWEDLEEKVYHSLQAYSERVPGGAGYGRRLFAGDASRGFAFIDVCRQRYDVVLMNPPFGEPTKATASIASLNPRSLPVDLYCLFVGRGHELAPTGLVGTISSSSFLLYTDYSTFREWLARDELVESLVDLGWGVLDAYVRTAMYCIRSLHGVGPTVFVDAASLAADGRDPARVLLNLTDATAADYVFQHSLKTFSSLSGAPFCYWFPGRFFQWAVSAPKLAGQWREHGIGAGPHNFFFRLRWEPDPRRLGRANGWPTLPNGGLFSPFYRDNALVIDWTNDGAHVRAHLNQIYPYLKGNIGIKIQRTHIYFEAGLTYGKRTDRFHAQVLPAGAIPSFNGVGAYPAHSQDRWWILGLMNSRYAAYFLNATCGLHKNSVYIDRIPVPDFGSDQRARLGEIAEEIYNLAREANAITETDSFFVLPALVRFRGDSLGEALSRWRAHDRRLEVRMWADLEELEAIIFSSLDLPEQVVRAVEGDQGPLLPSDAPILSGSLEFADPVQPFRPVLVRDDTVSYTDLVRLCVATGCSPEGARRLLDAAHYVEAAELRVRAAELISWAVGVCFGRFDVRRGLGVPPADIPSDPFEAVPSCSPGMLVGSDLLPVSTPPADYPVAVAADGILVDDPGDGRDLLRGIGDVFAVIFGDNADRHLREASAILGSRAADLRPWLRIAFFTEHIDRYSKARRRAPIYWRLGTPSGTYSVWIYVLRFAKDTLHRVLNDHLIPKLRFEDNRLTGLVAEAAGTPTSSNRRLVTEQELLVDELRTFCDDVARVAPLWDPNLDDGILINAAPLHRLFGHTKAWQKECAAAWDSLRAEESDWSHLAMRLWPERVVPKCAIDRSLAVAHGLERMFWSDDGDGKWSPRGVAADDVERLVQERSAPSVKAALISLARACVAAPPVRTGRPARPSPSPRGARTDAPRQLALPAPSSEPQGSALHTLRAAFHQFPDPASRADLIAASGLDEASWQPTIDALVARGEVERTGQARGTRYSLVVRPPPATEPR